MKRIASASALAFLSMAAMFTGSAQAAPCGFFSPKPDDDTGPPVQFYADLSAAEESAVTESPGNAHVEFLLDRKSSQLTWKVTYKNLTAPPLSIGIHGPQTPGSEAGKLYDLAQKQDKDGVTGSVILKDADVTYLVHDRYYVNITTRTYPNGEVRGPIKKRAPAC